MECDPLRTIAERHGMNVNEMIYGGRTARIVVARDEAILWLRDQRRMSYQAIADKLLMSLDGVRWAVHRARGSDRYARKLLRMKQRAA